MSAMAKVELPYVQAFTDRHGHVRHYFRRKGYKSATLNGEPGSELFAAEYQAALASSKPAATSLTEGPRSVGALIAQYYLSADFRALKASSQRTYKNVLEQFRLKHGPKGAATIQDIHLNAIFHAMAATPAQALVLRKRLMPVFELGKDLGWRKDNPVRNSKKLKHKSKGFAPWSEDDIAAYERRWAPGTRQRLALCVLLYTGQRRSDAATLGPQHRTKTGKISVAPIKSETTTGKRLVIPIHPRFEEELALHQVEGLAYLLTQYGKPFSAPGFTNWFVDQAKAAGLIDRTPHGLRKACSRRLAEAGCTTRQLMAILGWESIAEAERYTRDAGQEKLADQAMDNLLRAEG